MDLPTKLEKWAREMDRERWHDGKYDVDMVELCDLLREAARAIEIFNALAVGHALEKHRLQVGNDRLGPWMAAALDDPSVCAEMKTDIKVWFDAPNR